VLCHYSKSKPAGPCQEREILHGLSLTVTMGQVHAIMGAERLRQVDALPLSRRQARLLKSPAARSCSKGEDLLAMVADARAAKGCSCASPTRSDIPGVATMNSCARRLNAQRKARGEANIRRRHFREEVREVAEIAEHPASTCSASASMSASPAARRNANEVLQMALFEREPVILVRTWISGSTSTRSRNRRRRRQRRCVRRKRAMVVIYAIYQRLSQLHRADVVHVMSKGRVERAAAKNWRLELEASVMPSSRTAAEWIEQ